MNEILGISDRALIFCEGAITGNIERAAMNSNVIMRYAVNIENDYHWTPEHKKESI
jgi:ABC-type sugar transport system ATPase subunit